MHPEHASSYEDVPYQSRPLYPTHPDCMATVAALMGMQAAPIDGCRVLELGCATGGNLIPMAATLPGSQFLGIDLAPSQIEQGQAVIDALNLSNIELHAKSILDIDEHDGRFDYIICHGVYSWVPPAVQDKILDIMAQNLNPNGIGYISYNTYPGWHARGLVREMIGFHAKQFADSTTRVQQARAFLEFLVRSAAEPDGTYAHLLKEEAELLRPEADYYVFHEHLEDVNQPLYFHEFAKRLTGKGLQYLGEAWQHTHLESFPQDVREILQGLSADLIHLEQYIDFLTNRTFRRSLVCHDNLRLPRTPSVQTVAALYFGALVRPTATDSSADSVEAFRADDGKTISTNIPVVKAALHCLFEAWPEALSFNQLWSSVLKRLGQQPDSASSAQSPALLAESLLSCYMSQMVALHVRPPRLVRTVSRRPRAFPLAKFQAQEGLPITNLRHRIVPLDEFDRQVLGCLDGERDPSGIADELTRQGQSAIVAADRMEAVGASLQRLAQQGLLVA